MKNKLYLSNDKLFFLKTNDIIYCMFEDSQDYPNCRTDLVLKLLKFISLKVG